MVAKLPDARIHVPLNVFSVATALLRLAGSASRVKRWWLFIFWFTSMTHRETLSILETLPTRMNHRILFRRLLLRI